MKTVLLSSYQKLETLIREMRDHLYPFALIVNKYFPFSLCCTRWLADLPV